jgi:hypothetical protein
MRPRYRCFRFPRLHFDPHPPNIPGRYETDSMRSTIQPA